MKRLLKIISVVSILSLYGCSTIPKYSESAVTGPKAKITLAGTSVMSEIPYFGMKTKINMYLYDYEKLLSGEGCEIDKGLFSKSVSYKPAILGRVQLKHINETKTVSVPAKPLYIHYVHQQTNGNGGHYSTYRLHFMPKQGRHYKFMYEQKKKEVKQIWKKDKVLEKFSTVELINGKEVELSDDLITDLDESKLCTELSKTLTK